MELDNSILVRIVNQIGELYVRNDSPTELIARHQGAIPLHEYMCFTYGNKPFCNKRIIHVMYFLSKSHCSNQIPYQIALYDRQKKDYNIFWVENTGVLKKDFLEFSKKNHLFRNTFLYDPISQNIYRLHELKPYLHLPEESIVGKTVWTSRDSSYIATEFMADDLPRDTALVPTCNKYKQILDLCDQLNALIQACH